MKSRELSFDSESEVFILVVRAIIISDHHLLAIKHNTKSYYYTIGGTVHLNESSVEALLREIAEETRIDMEIDRFGFIHENFYIRDGVRYHEIGMYYYMVQIPGLTNIPLQNAKGDELIWLPINHLHEYELYPTFFKNRLQSPKQEIDHIFTWENIGNGMDDGND